MNKEFSTIKLERRDRIAWLVLNRPEVLNAIDVTMLKEIEAALVLVAEDDAIGALVIRGAGRAFSAGGDLKAAKALNGNPPAFMKFARLWNKVFNAVEEFEKPTVAAVHGHCLAGGLELVLCCDISVAAEDANIGDHHAKFALLPGAGSSQRLPRLIGLQLAKDLLYTGRGVSGAEAARMGLVCRSVPSSELETAVLELASELASKPADLLPTLKRIVNRGINGELHAGLELEIQAIHGSLLSPTRNAGMADFQERKE